MIVGQVNGRHEPVIEIEVIGPASTLRLEAVVDTGYTGALTLSLNSIQQLGLPWKTWETARLADDSLIPCDVFEGTVSWDEESRAILIAEGGSTPLVGMKLLDGYRLTVDAFVGGMVTIKRLPSDN